MRQEIWNGDSIELLKNITDKSVDLVLTSPPYDDLRSYNTGSNTASNPIAFKHPAIFPEALATDHITSWTNENDLVLDPFAGSGTTLLMAKNLNRQFIGIEKEKEYYDICLERLK